MKNRLLQEWRCTVDAFMPSDAQKCSGHLWLSLVIKSDMQVRKCELNKEGKKKRKGRKEKNKTTPSGICPSLPSYSRERIEFSGILPDVHVAFGM